MTESIPCFQKGLDYNWGLVIKILSVLDQIPPQMKVPQDQQLMVCVGSKHCYPLDLCWLVFIVKLTQPIVTQEEGISIEEFAQIRLV